MAISKVRLEASKGKFDDIDIVDIVKNIHEHESNVLADYIVGLEGETKESMQKTLDLSKELCTRGWNMYAAMAFPGSRLYATALANGVAVPDDYLGHSFHSYETTPLPTDNLMPAEILDFQDKAWQTYHTYLPFLKLVQKKRS